MWMGAYTLGSGAKSPRASTRNGTETIGPQSPNGWVAESGNLSANQRRYLDVGADRKIVDRVVALADIRTHTYVTTRRTLAKRWGRVQNIRDRLFGAVLSVWGNIPSEP